MGYRKSRAHKRHLEKRRRTRKQRGGGEALKSIGEWVAAVKRSPAFKKEESIYRPDPTAEPSFRLGAYRFPKLTDPSTQLPNIDESNDSDNTFDINFYAGVQEDPVDIRVEGANISAKWEPFLSVIPPPTPVDFKLYIDEHMNTDVMKVDPDFRTAVNHLIALENKLRRDENPITSLSDESKYPLFVWALMMNGPDKSVGIAPSLYSQNEVKEEFESQGR